MGLEESSACWEEATSPGSQQLAHHAEMEGVSNSALQPLLSRPPAHHLPVTRWYPLGRNVSSVPCQGGAAGLRELPGKDHWAIAAPVCLLQPSHLQRTAAGNGGEGS